MVALILLLMFSCSWFFGYAMTHPEMSYWYPVLYTTVIVLGMCAPYAFDYISLRRPDAKPGRGGRHTNRSSAVATL